MTNPTIDPAVFEQLKTDMGADFMIEIIDAYLEETPQLLSRLHQALQAKDAESFRRAAHSIKSSSAALGAMGISERARKVEMLGKDGALEGSAPLLERMDQDYKQVMTALEGMRDGA